MSRTIRSHARFSTAPSRRRVEGGFAVYPDAHIFSIGDYKDKRFSMSESEAAAAVAAFKPVSGDIEHTKFLKGRAVQVRSLRLDDDRKRLRGEVAVPLALDELIEDAERKLSAEWDRETKQLVGVALTLNPRVEEASLIVGFNATLQRITKEASAGCSLAHVTIPSPSNTHLMSMEVLENPERIATRPRPRRRVTMTAREKLQEYLDGLADGAEPDPKAVAGFVGLEVDDDEAEAPAEPQTPDPANFNDSPEAKALFARLEKLEAERIAARKKEIARDAAQFAEEAVRSGRATAAEAPSLVVAFAQAATDDDATPTTVTFSAAGKEVKGTRLDALKALIAARPARHYGEHLGSTPAAAFALANEGDAAVDKAAYRASRLANTDIGRNILARERANGHGKTH